MRILLTTPYRLLPTNTGGAVRTMRIAIALQQLGNDVHILCAEPGTPQPATSAVSFHTFKYRGSVGHFFNSDFRRRLCSVLKQPFDLVISAFPFQSWMLAKPIGERQLPVIYDAHNVETDRFRRMRKPLVASLIMLAERRMCRLASQVITVSEDDRQLMEHIHNTPSIVMANGVDLALMSPGQTNPETLKAFDLQAGNYAIFFGGYDYPPNVEAARFLIERVWPQVSRTLPSFKLALVGRLPPAWTRGHNNVVVTDVVDDLTGLVRGARLALAPLFSGGGTRLKILEALACGKDVLATPFGAKGIAHTDTPALRLSPPETYADDLVAIAETPVDDLCGNHGARKLAEAFDWRNLVTAALAAVEHVTAKA